MKIGEITGVILAGGKNLRSPILKGFIKIDNSTIIEKNLVLMREMFEDVFISANMPEVYFYLGVSLIGDVLPSRGPMSGIQSSLMNAKGDSIFVIACDMPFVRKDVVSFICVRHEQAVGMFDATIPVHRGEPQPLLGVYCKSVMPYLEDGILNDKTSMKKLLYEIKTNFIDESDIMTVDPDGRSFVNINTAEDYESALKSIDVC